MFFCLWVAVDENGRCYVYREFAQNDMVVSKAAAKQLELTRPDENIYFSIAPPDMWSRSNDTGKTRAATFAEHGVSLLKADNNRIQGWSALKELFKLRADGKPGLILFDTCGTLIECVKCLQHDKKNVDDVSKEPHGITHGPDALRYFAQTYVLPAEAQQDDDFDDDASGERDYRTAMCGTGVNASYVFA
jgi:phage terminase large subunit